MTKVEMLLKSREEFLGFVPLQNMDAETIAETIIDYGEKIGLNLDEKLMGQGYDGCSTMAGKDNGVQESFICPLLFS